MNFFKKHEFLFGFCALSLFLIPIALAFMGVISVKKEILTMAQKLFIFFKQDNLKGIKLGAVAQRMPSRTLIREE